MSNETYEKYYVPEQSKWPAVGALALLMIIIGAGQTIHDIKGIGGGWGHYVLFAGIATVIFFMFGWFRDIINESLGGKYSRQMDRSFRMGMLWFIGSEVMFFAGFFGALFYARMFVVPWLGGAGNNFMTHELLWPDFIPRWPLTVTPGGETTEAMPPWGLPFINTILLVTSSFTLTWAHHALKANNRMKTIIGLALTLVLGFTFLSLQVEEYIHAYTEMGLTLGSGIYGSTFFMLTGFHGMHVTVGAIMLTVMLFRAIKGHFTPEKHFAFEAAAWYWHFVDVVWIALFAFVYVL
jgi:cytochrome c oxidase subunit 3